MRARTESRTGSAHWRIDHPQPDEQHWRQFVLVSRGASGPQVETLTTDHAIADAFARNKTAAAA